MENTNKKITVIAAKNTKAKTAYPKVRVAAYCRVSTDKEDQQDSLENQMEGFKYQMKLHPDWELVKIYADEGITGTSAKKRPQFMELMTACREGKVDYVITKSISRFARNTLDCIKYVREIKEYGVHVLFEKESIDTASSTSEMLLTIMASFAQEESRSISENLKWGIRKRFEEGIDVRSPIYGYKHTDTNTYVIVPEEAMIVKEIFTRYVHGEEFLSIMNDMIRRGEKAPTKSGWDRQQFDRMIKNERYTGDSLLQKTYIVDHLTHKQVKNEGEVNKYLLENDHPAIVDKHLFQQAKQIRELRYRKYGNPTYPYGEMLKCPHCGKTLVHGSLNNFFIKGKNINNGGWGCYGDGGCREYLLIQNILDEALIKAYKTKFGEEKKSVEFYWIDDTIESISLTDDTVIIHWKDGEVSEDKLKYVEARLRPAPYADFYNTYLRRLRNGEIKVKKKNLMGMNTTEESK